MTKYSVRRLKGADINYAIGNFLYQSVQKLNKENINFYKNASKFPIQKFADRALLFVCFRDDEPVGFLGAILSHHMFDPEVVVLTQQLLYSSPGTRAAYHLMKEFIDFGKAHANHVITTIGLKTNIKSSSLERLGFTKLEELYRMEF